MKGTYVVIIGIVLVACGTFLTFYVGTYVIIFGIVLIAFGTFLTYYGQELQKIAERKEFKKWEDKISITLINTLYRSMSDFFETIKTYSTAKPDTTVITLETFKVLCKGCLLDHKVNVLKSVPPPFVLFTLREYLIYNWMEVCKHINEINSASKYISPESYNLLLRIKDAGDQIPSSLRGSANSDLEAWHVMFFKLYNLNIELKKILDNIEK